MSWTVTVDFGGGAVDLMDDWDVEDISKTQVLHKDLRPTVNYCQFTVTDKTLANSFLTTIADIPITIQKDAADWFVGIIRHNYTAEVGADFKQLTVEAVDKSILLQKKIDTTIAWSSYKVCNPSSKAASILHQLFYEAGIIDAELDLSLIDKTIDHFVVEKSDDLNYDKTIAQLLYEFGYVYDVGDDGIFVLHDLYPAAVAGAAIEDADIEHVFRTRRQERKYEGARIIWYPHTTITDALVFSDTTDGDEENKCEIPIAAGEYYPPNSDVKDVYSRYDMQDYDIIIVTGEELDWVGTNVTENVFTPGTKRALVSFTSAGGGTLHKFDIRGDAVVRDLLDEHRSVRRAVADTDKILEYEAQYITADVDANRLSNGLADYYNSSAFGYTFPTEEDLSPGDILDLTEDVMSISTDLRVVAVQEDEWGFLRITAEAISAYSINATTSEDEKKTSSDAEAVDVKVVTYDIATSDEHLVGYWSMNDSPDDFSGRGHHAIQHTGAGGYEQGVVGKAFRYADDGDTSYHQVPHTTDHDFGTGDFGIALRFNTDAIDADDQVLFTNRTGATDGLIIQIDGSEETIRFGVGTGATIKWATAAIVAGTDYFLVATRRDGALYIYLNGGLVDTNLDGDYTVTTSADLFIGTDFDTPTADGFDGPMEEIRLYNIGLSQANISYLYRSPDGVQPTTVLPNSPVTTTLLGYWSLNETLRDFSGKDKHGVFNADGGNYEDTPTGKAYHFNPVTNDSIQLPTDLGTLTTFTICGRFKIDTLSPIDSANRLLELRQSSDDDNIRIIFDSAGDDKLYFICREAATNYAVNSNIALEASRWYFFVAAYDGETVRLYLNNVLQEDTAALSGATWTTDENAIGSLGNSSSANNWDGLIAQVRLYDGILTSAEREYLMVNPQGNEWAGPEPIDPGTDNLVGYWPCDETSDPIINVGDVSGQGNHLDDVTESVAFVDGHVFNALESVTGAGKVERSHDISTVLSDTLSTGDFSISDWVWFGAEADFNDVIYFLLDTTDIITFKHGNDDATNPGFQFFLYDGADYQLVQLSAAEAAGILEYDKWHYIVCTVDRTDKTLKLYIDGVFILSAYYAAIHTFTAVDEIRFLSGNVIGDKVDEPRVYSKILDFEEQLYLFRNPGGTPHGMSNANNTAVAEVDAFHSIWGGDISLITNTEIWRESYGELFPLGPSCLSDHGKSPTQKRIWVEQALLADEDEVLYNNPRARVWDGLHDDPRTDTIGVWEETENVVEDPTDLTAATWDISSGETTTLVDKYIGNHQFSKVLNSGAAVGFRGQTIDTTGFAVTTPVMQATIMRGSGTGDIASVRLTDTSAPAIRANFTVNWAAGTVSATHGTIVDEDWISADIVHVSIRLTTITPANTHQLYCYASDDAVASEYNYYTAVQVEDKLVPTPFAYGKRRDGLLAYRKPLTNAGTIDLWVRPRDMVRQSGRSQTVLRFSNLDGTRYFQLYWLTSGTHGQWRVVANLSGVTPSLIDPTTYNTDAAFHKWWHLQVAWNFSGNTGELKVDGVSRDTSWNIAPGAMDDDLNTLALGCTYVPDTKAITLHLNGEFSDLTIQAISNPSTSHFDEDKPWKPQYLAGNYYQTVSISRRAITLTRADLSMFDVYGRSIDLGSQGIKALDAQGQTIHQLPNGPVLRDMAYLGHPILKVAPEAIDSSLTFHSNTSATLISAVLAAQNLDVSALLPPGTDNAQGLIVNVTISFIIESSKVQAHNDLAVRWIPLFEYNVVPTPAGVLAYGKQLEFHFHGGVSVGHLFERDISANCFIPIVYNGNTPYISWTGSWFLNDLKAVSGDVSILYDLYIIGVFV